MREYAGCVETVYPAPMNGNEILAGKALFVIALIGLAIGVWKSHKDNYNDGIVDYALDGVIGWRFLTLPCAAAFIAGVLYGIWRLLA